MVMESHGKVMEFHFQFYMETLYNILYIACILMNDIDLIFFTFVAFRALLDNYESESGKQEEVTSEEEDENRNFLDAVLETAVMQEAHAFLVEQDKSPEDVDEFKQQLYNIWFKIYKRLREHR